MGDTTRPRVTDGVLGQDHGDGGTTHAGRDTAARLTGFAGHPAWRGGAEGAGPAALLSLRTTWPLRPALPQGGAFSLGPVRLARLPCDCDVGAATPLRGRGHAGHAVVGAASPKTRPALATAAPASSPMRQVPLPATRFQLEGARVAPAPSQLSLFFYQARGFVSAIATKELLLLFFYSASAAWRAARAARAQGIVHAL